MFNQQIFSSILNSIISKYESLRDFSNVSGFNRTSISKYVRKELKNPPSPKILQKIAEGSKGLTTYNELMQICGYIPNNININFQSLDMQLSESIFNNHISLLSKYDLSNSNILDLKKILMERNEHNSPITSQLNNFAISNSSNAKELFATLININDEISKALINLHKNGYLYPVPVYKNTKNIDLFLVSDIVDYVNFNIPSSQSAEDYFALLIDNDSMAFLLDINDIAIIHKETEFVNGQIVATYSTTREKCIIGKLFKYDNIIELSYLNAKTEKFIVNDIKFLGRVIRAENTSAFK
ncbi:MAG: hypothetical protein HFJ53_01970 [Clostridia bacterium]|nr:hypothetical protein [Clostridia bacterium]